MSIIYSTLSTMMMPTFSERKSKFLCVYNDQKQRLCFTNPVENNITCDPDYCKVKLETTNSNIIRKQFPKGVFLLQRPMGLLSKFDLIGIFPRDKLKEVTDTIGQPLPINSIDKIKEPMFGLPEPPKSCRWAPWKDECVEYGNSPEWNFSIWRGWKKTKQ